MANASKAARLSDAQDCAAQKETSQSYEGRVHEARLDAVCSTRVKNCTAQNNPMVTVYDGGITEEIVHGRLDTKLNFQFARNWGSYPLKDGRYVYEEWNESKKNPHPKRKVYSGLSQELFMFLAETDRNDTNGQRKNKDHADYGSNVSDGQEDDEIGEYHRSAIDRAAYQQWLYRETWEEGEDDPIFSDELLKTDFAEGDNKVNNQRWLMRRQVIEQFIPNLPKKEQETFIRYYGSGMTEEEIGAEEGIGKQAICNRLARVKASLRSVFSLLGIPTPTDDELEAERKERREKTETLKEAEKEQKSYEKEARATRAIMRKENKSWCSATGNAQETEDGEETETPEDAFYEDYDPDNPYDSVSEDFDPYEAYDTYRDMGFEEDYWEEDTDD